MSNGVQGRMRGSVILLISFLILSGLSLRFAPVSAGFAWTIEVADGQYQAGMYLSIAVSPSGWPAVSYQVFHSYLAYAWRDAAGWHNETVDPGGVYGAGDSTSLAFDLNGIPHIAYLTVTITGLEAWYAYWNTSTLSWKREHVAAAGLLIIPPVSLALDSTGNPRIAYVNSQTGELLLAVRDALGMWTSEFVSHPRCCTNELTLKMDSMDIPHIAVYNYTSPGLDFMSKNGSTWVRDSVDTGVLVGQNPSLAFNKTDSPRIAYADANTGQLKYAVHTPTGWNIAVVPTSVTVASELSLALDPADRPCIAYTFGQDIMYAYWDGSSWLAGSVISDSARMFVSLAVDSSGVAHIAYLQNDADLGLKYAKGVPTNNPPTSIVQAISPYWRNTAPLTINASASDPDGPVTQVDLYCRFNGGSGWSAWASCGSSVAPPWQWLFNFPDGEGLYEFYSLAFDGQDWELKTAAAEASAGCDSTPPVSSALPISPYWRSAPLLDVSATATDNLSGVHNITLLYSYAPLDNSSWSAWAAFGTKNSPPWSWSFPFPDGKGNYKFHTIASDVAGNVEGAKTIAEAVAGYNGTAPVTMPDYSPINEQPVPPVRVGLSSPVHLSLAVHNGGNATATTDSVLAFYNSTAPATPFRTFTVNPIAPGDNSSRFIDTWTSPAIPGSYSVSVDVDYENNVSEWDETNNAYMWTIEVVSGPVTSLVVGNPNYTSPAMATYVKSTTPLSFSVLDQSGLGIRNTTYRIDGGDWVNHSSPGSFFLAGEGTHAVEWRSLDWAGNLEDVSSMDLIVDGTPPATALSIGEPKYLTVGTYVNSSTLLALVAVDDGVGLDHTLYNTTVYNLWSGSWSPLWGYTTPFTLNGRDGTWFIEFLSHDLLWNFESWRNETLVLDNTPPATILLPANGPYTTNSVFTLAAVDSGCGVNVTRYRINGGNLITYSGGFTLPEGVHNISYYSNDMLNNTERERWLVVNVSEPQVPPVEVTVNYKPIVAVIFAIVLFVAGVWSSKRRPWKGGKDKMAVMKAFAISSMPFVLAEAVTGITSLLTGELSIPPSFGIGIAVDSGNLTFGVAVAVYRIFKKTPETA